MTYISRLSGSRVSALPPALVKARAKRIPLAANMRREPEERLLNFGPLTDGQMYLALLLERIELKEGYYQDPKGIYAQAKNYLVNALTRGLHTDPTVGKPVGVVHSENFDLIRAIRSAKKMLRPAGGYFVTKSSAQPAISGGFDPYDPQGDLLNEFECIEWPEPQYPGHDPRADYNNCLRMNRWIRLLNNDFKKSAHHALYRFANSTRGENPVFVIKALNHGDFLGVFGQITGLGSMIDQWAINGVMRNNVQKGGEPNEPIESIELYRAGAVDGTYAAEGINDGGLTVAAILAIAKAVIAAVAAIIALTDKLKQSELDIMRSQLNQVPEAPNFGPNWATDFNFDPTNPDLTQAGSGQAG